jgi:hypothetical protein
LMPGRGSALARLWRRSMFGEPVTEPKRSQKSKGPASFTIQPDGDSIFLTALNAASAKPIQAYSRLFWSRLTSWMQGGVRSAGFQTCMRPAATWPWRVPASWFGAP